MARKTAVLSGAIALAIAIVCGLFVDRLAVGSSIYVAAEVLGVFFAAIAAVFVFVGFIGWQKFTEFLGFIKTLI